MTIPVQNIYFLLCYAWANLEQRDSVNIDAVDPHNVSDLYARVLSNGVQRLIKRGLDRSYTLHSEETPRLRGRIDFAQSIKRQTWQQGRMHCEFDELSHNILHNQIIKTTIGNLINTADLSRERREELVSVNRYLKTIDRIHLTAATFKRVQLHRNNSHYRLLLSFCELIRDSLLPEKDAAGRRLMKEFIENEQKMPKLFENFVKHFYQKEQTLYRVSSKRIDWDATWVDQASKDALPSMLTDVTLESPGRKIIIDCKFYKEALTQRWGREIIHSANLYQLFTYLKNKEKDSGWENCEGILLYPTVQESYDFNYTLAGHKVRIYTLNLNQHWTKISEELKQLVNDHHENKENKKTPQPT